MPKTVEEMRLYCFSPGPFLRGRDPIELVEAQIRGGADVIQLREKELPKRERLALGFKIREITRRHHVLFIVNDDLDLALILEADGLHLGQGDIPIACARPFMRNAIIGVSTHSVEQAEAAVKAGADYIGFGPVFPTGTKPDREPEVGVGALGDLSRRCPIPCVAIGGITLANLPRLVGAGCRSAAIISDILRAGDTKEIEERCRAMKRLLP